MNRVSLKTTTERHSTTTGITKHTIEKGFAISATSADSFNLITYPDATQYVLQKGDEVIVPFKTGGSLRGWFLGLGKTNKHVCVYWTPWRNKFYIVDVQAVPVRADWSKFVLNNEIALAREQIELYKQDNNKAFALDFQF